MSEQSAMMLLAEAFNLWLITNGLAERVTSRQVFVTQRDGVWFLAFAPNAPRPAPQPPINRQDVRQQEAAR